MGYQDTSARPAYFQPRPGQGELTTGQAPRLPAHIIDMFYLREPGIELAERVIIAGCLEGAIDVFTNEAVATLEHHLQSQIQTVDVNQRGCFRAITAKELYIATLDAIEQEVRAPGFNDAVYLYGRMQAKIAFDSGKVQVARLDNEGRFTIGRIDVLHAYKEAAARAFQNPSEPGEHMYHLMVPAAPLDTIKRGYGVTLVYPFLDPLTFSGADNVFIIMRIVYDLLSRLQQDMLQEQRHHPFTTATIPVPSRHRLENELQADGYTLSGDVAIKQPGEQSGAAQGQITFLSRLRHMAAQWAAPRIILPAQATPHDYRAMIDDVLPALATPADIEMTQTLSQIVEVDFTPMRRQPASPKPPPPRANQPARQPVTPPESIVRPAQPPTARPQQQDWSRDFVSPGVPRQHVTRKEAWWRHPTPTTSGAAPETITSQDDWTDDFLAERGSPRANMPERNSRPVPDDWLQDFGPPRKPVNDRSRDDWSNDFASNEETS